MFAAAACGGFLFILLIGMKKRYPRVFASGHGLLGLSALALLTYALTKSATPVPKDAWWAVGVLGAAWCGGFVMFRVLRPRTRSLWLALMHGSLGFLGVLLLARIVLGPIN